MNYINISLILGENSQINNLLSLVSIMKEHLEMESVIIEGRIMKLEHYCLHLIIISFYIKEVAYFLVI